MKHALWIPSHRGSLQLSRLLCSLRTSLLRCPQAFDFIDIIISVNIAVASEYHAEYLHLANLYSDHFKFVWNINSRSLDVMSHFDTIIHRHLAFAYFNIGILGDDEIVSHSFFECLLNDYFSCTPYPDLFVFRSYLIDGKANIFYLNERNKLRFWDCLESANPSLLSARAHFAPWDELLYGLHTINGLARLLRLASFFHGKKFISPGNLACASYVRTLSIIKVSSSYIIGSSTTFPIVLRSNFFMYPKQTDRVYRTLGNQDSINRRPVLNSKSGTFLQKLFSFFVKTNALLTYSFFIRHLPSDFWHKRPTVRYYIIFLPIYLLLILASYVLFTIFFILRFISSLMGLISIKLGFKPFLQDH